MDKECKKHQTPYRIIQEFDNQPSDFRQKMEALVPSVRKERLQSIKLELQLEKERQEKHPAF